MPFINMTRRAATFTAEKLVKEYGLKGYERTNGDFHRKVIKRASLAIKEAIPSAQTVTHYGWGEAEVEKVASNRRLLGPDGKVRAVRYTATRDPVLRAEPEGVIDPDVSLLSFWNGGKPVAVLSYYACHPQSYYRTGTPSPDFPGIARFMRGQGVPEALHVHFNGAGGNLGAGKYNDGNTENRMKLARRLAEGMAKAWRATEKRPLTAETIRFDVDKVRLPLADHLKNDKALTEAVKKEKARGYFSKVDQLAYARHWKAGNKIDVSCLSVGDSRILHMPGELFVEYQLVAKAMRPDLKVAMAAYGEYGTGYIGTEVSYSQGGYETSPGASAVGPGSEKVLTKTMKKLLGEQPKKEAGRVGPKSPEEAIASFETLPGFEVQLVACEPQVKEPIVVTYNENGLMYVAEYLKFPSHHGKSDGPDGRIRLLRDEDGNGHYETSEIFAKDIAWPTGICCWDGGVYVVAAPDLWYFKDTDGDGEANIREKVFTGFGFRNDEGTANNLFWGLDHWIYGAGSNSGGEIQSLGNKDAKSVSIRGRDFRFHPKTREFQVLSGGEQFGNTMDDFGNRFLTQNSKPAVHVVLPARYLERNPFLPAPATKKNLWKDTTIYRSSGIESWRLARTKVRLAGKRKYPPPSVAHDVFTGCSGATVYRGSVYPKEFRGNLFVGEVQGNLLHRREFIPDGVTFASERVEKESEFLRTTDNWFRPANLVNAPDGTLHVADMYRETIETPDSMVPEILAMVDFRSGHEYGRIYRVAPKGFQPPPPPTLGSATIQELVKELENPNGWWRDTAGRLLVERGDKSALPLLKKMLRESERALARLHALHTVVELGGLDEGDLSRALSDQSSTVREHGLKLYRPKFSKLKGKVIALANDVEMRVRFQAAFELGDLQGGDVAEALAKIVIRDGGDPWMYSAVMSMHPRLALPVFSGVQRLDQKNKILGQLAFCIGARNEAEEVNQFIEMISKNEKRAEYLLRLEKGLKLAQSDLNAYPKAVRLKEAVNPTALGAEIMRNLEGGGVLVRITESSSWLFEPSKPLAEQADSLREAALSGDDQTGENILESFFKLSPLLQVEVIEVLLGKESWTLSLLKFAEKTEIATNEIPLLHQQRLLQHSNEEIRKRAIVLFSQENNPRHQVVEKYRAALKLPGSVERGRRIFSENCMGCHKLGKIGFEIGPDLKTVKSRTPEAILIQILDPNRELLANYMQYFVALTDGRVVTGQIVSESSASLVLKRAGGVKETLFRKNVKSITSSEKSLMPEGLEAVIDHQAMSDLIAFLRSAN